MKSKFVLSKKSLSKLAGVHPDLIKVVKRAIELSEVDFSVLEGVRTLTKQQANVKSGVSQTLNSKHLVQLDTYGHAVDLVPYPLSWELEHFYPIMEAVRKASKELGIRIRWGGAWIGLDKTNSSPEALIKAYATARRKAGNKIFIDAPHFELY